MRWNDDVRVEGRFIRGGGGDAGEVGDEASPSFFVETLWITPFGFFEGDIDEDFDEIKRGGSVVFVDFGMIIVVVVLILVGDWCGV